MFDGNWPWLLILLALTLALLGPGLLGSVGTTVRHRFQQLRRTTARDVASSPEAGASPGG